MLVILLIAIIVIVILVKKKKAAQVEPEPVKLTMEDLPDSLTELRALHTKWKDNVFHDLDRELCEKKIGLIAAERFRQGKAVLDPGEENDVNALFHDLQFYEGETIAETRECLRLGLDTLQKYIDLANTDKAIYERYRKGMDPYDQYNTWERLARLYIDQNDGPRTELDTARRLLRQCIVFHQQLDKVIPLYPLYMLMQIPSPEEGFEEEIFKWISLGYSMGILRMRMGEIERNDDYQHYQQNAELLFQLDWQKLSSPDVNEMLDVYRKGVQQGNPYALYMLGDFYLDGRYVEQDVEKGLELLEQAYNAGLYSAALAIKCYYDQLAYGDHPGGKDEAEKERNEELRKVWKSREASLRARVEVEYADHFGKYVKNSVNQPTRMKRPVQQSQSSQYEETSSQSGGSVRNMPHFIYDDKGREWTFDQMFGSDRVRYVLSGGESTWADDLGDRMGEEVYISDSQISGNSASTGLRTFHW
jgi:TPR repeat protein